jgi:hypothetical protein
MIDVVLGTLAVVPANDREVEHEALRGSVEMF